MHFLIRIWYTAHCGHTLGAINPLFVWCNGPSWLCIFSIWSRSLSWFKRAIRECTATERGRNAARQVRASCPSQWACRSRRTERSIAGSYIIFPGPVISDNRLINEVGLLPIEHTGPEGRGERHAPERGPTAPISAWLNTARDLRIVRHRIAHPQTATLSSCQSCSLFLFFFFYISLLIFRYFPSFPPLTLPQFKTQDHIEVDGDNVGCIIAWITIDLEWICCKSSWSNSSEEEMF